MIPPQPAAEVAAQHLVLVAQHEQLGVLGQIGPGQHRQQAQQAPQQAVGERQQHSEIVPATLPIPQQNPSSRYEIEFPSGTGCRARAGVRPPARGYSRQPYPLAEREKFAQPGSWRATGFPSPRVP